ncbi:hydroxyacylglutathione hydrolase [Maritalea porphyrae]|uniref:Hydroxyacylglutathione hydrolase n=1 Tax=Maritalea porphyrae TaxID=880732 RepID=A0ABQ5UN06_9HYPH|nr:hydroxyacylglutathione hydrolase [Maritalea porphyrae]GLQ16603.1 hydroxyacylglutathione hydrolase [Maritalea porphyrae]
MFKIHQIPALETNFALIIECDVTGEVALIDAPDAQPILDAFRDLDLTPTKIFVTHHHWDHVQGIDPLREHFDLTVFGPKSEAKDIKQLDVEVEPGAMLKFGDGHLTVISCPGHTYGHIAYFLPEQPTLFAGDALFSLGCGRMFDGPPDQMWAGLKRLRDLPDATQLYCGHEYTLSNGAFASTIDPDNKALEQRIKEAQSQINSGQPTLPTNLGSEKLANPFLRADQPLIAEKLGLSGKDPVETFAALRKAKDQF